MALQHSESIDQDKADTSLNAKEFSRILIFIVTLVQVTMKTCFNI